MVDNLLFSLNSAAPIFLVLLAGYLIRVRGLINDVFVRQANRLIFYVALPVKLFLDVGRTSFAGGFDVRFIVFLIAGTLLSIPIAGAAAALWVKDPLKKGAFVQGSFRGNFLYVGYSLLENILGSTGTKAPIAFAFVVPLYNVLGILVLSFYSGSRDNPVSFKGTIKNIVTNPLLLAIGTGLLFSLAGLQLPILLERSFSYFGDLVTPLALLMIGASFRPERLFENIGISLLASSLKLVILPLLAVTAALWLGFDPESLIVIYIVFGVPTAATSYVVAHIMGGDKDLASSIIMLSTLLSVLTITLFVFGFRSLGLL